jgi:hypothetical protein
MDKIVFIKQLLDFLHDVYPEGGLVDNIYIAFGRVIKISEIDKTLAYLAEKGYINHTIKPYPVSKDKKLNIYAITASGIDYLEGL